MIQEKGTTENHFSNAYNALLEELNKGGNVLVMSTFGELGVEEVNDISYELENKLIESGTKKGLVKRIFSLVIEALQNIRLHGERDSGGVQQSFFIIASNPEFFDIICANVILDKNKEKVKSRIEHINSLDKPALKEYYMQVLTDGQISSKGGAGLGFITVAMKSQNIIDYSFESVEEGRSMFIMRTNLKTSKE